jgi:hypothetical protein
MSNPETTIVRYEQTVFICSCCGTESRSIYRHNGQWYCLSCLKSVGNTLGIRVNSFFAPDGFVEDHRRAAQATRIGPAKQDSSRKVAGHNDTGA